MRKTWIGMVVAAMLLGMGVWTGGASWGQDVTIDDGNIYYFGLGGPRQDHPSDIDSLTLSNDSWANFATGGTINGNLDVSTEAWARFSTTSGFMTIGGNVNIYDEG